MTNDNRQPRGIPVGGQFATGQRPESDDLAPEPYRPTEEEVDTLASWLERNTINQPINKMRRLAKEVLAAHGPNRDETAMRASAYRSAMVFDTTAEAGVLGDEIAELQHKRNRVNIIGMVNKILLAYPETTALTVRQSGERTVWWAHRRNADTIPFTPVEQGADMSDREAWAEFAISYDGKTTGDSALEWDAKTDRLKAATIDLSMFPTPIDHPHVSRTRY